MARIRLSYGASEPLDLEIESQCVVAHAGGPAGVSDEAAFDLVASVIATPATGPPLASHLVPGDRVVIAISGEVPQAAAVVAAVRGCLETAGVDPADVTVLCGGPLEIESGVVLQAGGCSVPGGEPFEGGRESATSYLAADEAGRPLYLARALVDAHVVVTVGEWGWDAALGGRSVEGELWPAFSRPACRRELLVSLARKGRGALADWRTSMQHVAWQLGVCASLRLVRGAAGSLHTACFGLPEDAVHRARDAATAWSPEIPRPADLAVVSLSENGVGLGRLTRGVAAAARVTRPGGTICVASRLSAAPGPVFLRWRQAAPLDRLVHEAVGTGDPSLVADALQTRLFARALDDRRLVLLSDLDEATVEDLEFGYAAGPEAVERLARRAGSVVVLDEADRMLPRL